jgi:alpha-tubulin suppressor-like RCC1 family protein
LTPASVIDFSNLFKNKTITAIAAGWDHTLALTKDSRVFAWGYNNNGQLGGLYGTTQDYPVAMYDNNNVLVGKTIIAIEGGGDFSAVLTNDSKIYTWGGNVNGQLGTGYTSSSSFPVPVVDANSVFAGKIIIAISCGGMHIMALAKTGELTGWGDNTGGKIGDGTTASRTHPVSVIDVYSVFVASQPIIAVSAGYSHTMALSSAGNVYGWGSGLYGQLGNGATATIQNPVAVIDANNVFVGKTIIAIDTGMYFSVALSADVSLRFVV